MSATTWRRRLYDPSPLDPSDEDTILRFPEFQLDDRVFVVTGGARGLGLAMAETLVEAGAHGSLHYHCADVQYPREINNLIADIAAKHERLDGLVAAAGIQNPVPALDYPPQKVAEMWRVNYGGVFTSAIACARQMIKYKTSGAMVLVASTSGLDAIKGFNTSVHSSTKGAVIQLGRSLATEWGKIIDGRPIRVNVLCPGKIITPMVEEDLEENPSLQETWEKENVLGRLSKPCEYKGATLFMLSDASSFMTGSHIVIDGGYTA